jgi:hypothetical protein
VVSGCAGDNFLFVTSRCARVRTRASSGVLFRDLDDAAGADGTATLTNSEP